MQKEYDLYKDEQFRRYEGICRRCGACCGSEDPDPCSDLIKDKDGRYFCRVYENRLEEIHETKSGNKFHCVPIGDIINNIGARPNCAYIK